MARRFFGLMFAILTATLVVGHAQQPNATTPTEPRVESFSYDLLYSFTGSPNGAFPLGSPFGGGALIQGGDGNYYGTAEGGGANAPEECRGELGCGAIFRITPSGTLTILYSFCSQINCADGFQPVGGLVQGGDGDFYGLTDAGGANVDRCVADDTFGCGTIFKITPSGVLTTLYSFCSQTNCTDGESPNAGLIEGSDGNFYGTTPFGGANPEACAAGTSYGCGTIFKISPSGTFTTLYNFCSQTDCADGILPTGGLLQGSGGTFYGTTDAGGANTTGALCNDVGCGTVFKITSQGTLTTLYSFCSKSDCVDGVGAAGSLVEGSDGNFYDTTGTGGANTHVYCNGNVDGASCGTVFKVTPSGEQTVLYSFCGQSNCADGDSPVAGLFLGSDGNFYGTTVAGGAYASSCAADECGTAFQVTPSGTETVLYSFCSQTNCADGSDVYAAPVQGSDGNFYGAAEFGGASDRGAIYKLSPTPALAPPIQFTLSESTITSGNSVTLSWSVLNAFSTTMQQCYAFVQGGVTGAGAWTGLQTGALANNIYSGSATITPTAAGTYTYALTCGGIESGFATLTVDASETADLTFTSVTHNLGSVQVGSSTSGVSNYGVKITNTSGAAISATGISLTGSNEFKYQTNCPAKLAAGAYCEVLFTFAPTSTGTVTASWSIAGLPEGTTFNPSNGGTLTGTGVPANGLNLTTSVHNFGSVTVGTSSPVYGTVLTNSYSFPVTLTYTTSGSTASFPLVTNCGAVLYAGESCNSNFTFTPKATGFVTETIGVTASYNGNPIAVTSLGQTVTGFTLKGTGQ